MEGCLEDLSSQRPLADTLEGVKIQKQWYQVRGRVGELSVYVCRMDGIYMGTMRARVGYRAIEV